MVSVPAFAAEGTDAPQAQEKTVEQDEQKGEKSAKEEQEKTEQSVKEEKIEDGISAASDDDQETAVAEGEVFAKGDCGATEEDEVSWKLVKNDDTGRWLYLDHFGRRQHCRLLREKYYD